MVFLKQEDWRNFRAIRNQVTSLLRRVKKKWESDKLDLLQNNSSNVWKTVKGWLGWGSMGTPTQLFSEGRMITSPFGIATAMNNFFLNKIKNLRSSTLLSNGDPISKLREAMVQRLCTF